MPVIVYTLCTLTSLVCAYLLLKGYRARRTPLLLWSGLCFVGLTLNHALVFVDLILVPDRDLFVLRTLPAALGMMALVFGLIWESE